eukprot:6336971-Alexandrium_andersonii.AAC.1
MYPASSVMASPASVQVQVGPCVTTDPSNCLCLHPETAGCQRRPEGALEAWAVLVRLRPW